MEEIHNHKKNMDNLLVSITKFFGLDHDLVSLSKLNRYFDEEDYKNLIVLSYDCLDTKVFSKYLDNSSFLGSHKFFNISVPKMSEDELRHSHLLDRINLVDGCCAYGVFPFGNGAYSSIEEAQKRIINLSNGNCKRLIYVSYRGFYEANKDGINKINNDCLKLCEQLDNSVILILGESTKEDIKTPVCVIKRMSSSEKVRLATLKDLNVINSYIKESWLNRINNRSDLFTNKRKFLEYEFYNYCTKSNGEVCFIYEISEEIVGFIFAKLKFIRDVDTYTERSYVSIENIYVREEYRRRGIGTKLYEEVMRYAKSIRIKKIEFTVYEFEGELISFIESLNCKKVSCNYEFNLVDVN